MFIETLAKLLHDIPHLNFHFKTVDKSFDLDFEGPYVQSIFIFCALSLLLALLLLLIIIVTWICQCCRRKTNNVRSRRRVRNLSTVLFILSLICFILLGVGLFGNDHINKGVNSAIASLDDVNRNVKLAISQCDNLNSTQYTAVQHVEELVKLVERKAKEIPDINQTAYKEVDTALTAVSDKVDDIKTQLVKIGEILVDVKFLEKAEVYGDRIEFERWILGATLLSIMFAVLFAGIIAFCRQSRKGAIVFSGLGLAIFILAWIIFSVVFPLSIAHADFCVSGNKFLSSKLNEEIIKSLHFYKTCEYHPAHDNVPPNIPLAKLSTHLTSTQEAETHLENLLNNFFNQSVEIQNVTRLIDGDVSQAFKNIGALESTLSCYAIREDVVNMHEGFCTAGILGAIILSLSLLLMGIVLFVLLVVVSKSWDLFIRLPSDYVEVGEDDPFYPRAQDSAIPADIYGTHVFNPRTRFTNSMDRTEPSTGTTTASGLPNGQHPSTPLLDTAWQRNNASAPNASVPGSISANHNPNRFS